MLTYAISLQRSTQRYAHIQQHLAESGLEYELIHAVDGALLTEDDLAASCDMEAVRKARYWLNNGAIGCALSHLKAYKEFLKTDRPCAFFVEDDVVLPDNIHQILADVEKHIRPSEVILLYYASFSPAKISTVGQTPISSGNLCYPLYITQTITATAYVVGKAAAENMVAGILPIRVAADCWHCFYKEGYFHSFRVHYPMAITTRNFKSSIDYIPRGSMKAKVADFIDRKKVPVLFQLIRWYRKRRVNSMLVHFSLTDEISPIYEKVQNEPGADPKNDAKASP